jgi:hypothetical protein
MAPAARSALRLRVGPQALPPKNLNASSVCTSESASAPTRRRSSRDGVRRFRSRPSLYTVLPVLASLRLTNWHCERHSTYQRRVPYRAVNALLAFAPVHLLLRLTGSAVHAYARLEAYGGLFRPCSYSSIAILTIFASTLSAGPAPPCSQRISDGLTAAAAGRSGRTPR